MDEDVCLTQAQIAEFYNTTRENITMPILNIYKDAELEKIQPVRISYWFKQRAQSRSKEMQQLKSDFYRAVQLTIKKGGDTE